MQPDGSAAWPCCSVRAGTQQHQESTTKRARRDRPATSRLDGFARQTLALRRGSQTHQLQLYVARTGEELANARALLNEGFPGKHSLVEMIINSTGREFENVRLMCLSEASAPLEPVSVAAVVTADHRTRTKDDRLRVRLLSTRQTKQRQGFGSYLLKNLARVGAMRGMPETFVEAAEGNEVFWKKAGFPRLDEAARRKCWSEFKNFSSSIRCRRDQSFIINTG